MSVHVFAYIMLTGLALLSAYALGLSTPEPQPKDYKQETREEADQKSTKSPE